MLDAHMTSTSCNYYALAARYHWCKSCRIIAGTDQDNFGLHAACTYMPHLELQLHAENHERSTYTIHFHIHIGCTVTTAFGCLQVLNHKLILRLPEHLHVGCSLSTVMRKKIFRNPPWIITRLLKKCVGLIIPRYLVVSRTSCACSTSTVSNLLFAWCSDPYSPRQARRWYTNSWKLIPYLTDDSVYLLQAYAGSPTPCQIYRTRLTPCEWFNFFFQAEFSLTFSGSGVLIFKANLSATEPAE